MIRFARLFSAICALAAVIFVAGPSAIAASPDIAAGVAHSLALKFDGTVWAWGSNVYGQLGDKTNTDRLTPVQVSGLTNVVAIAAGFYHNVAIKSDGTVWAWGQNSFGQLGDTTTVDKNKPVQVTGVAGATAIAAGAGHSLFLTSSGLKGVGLNTAGQVGDGTNTNRSTAVAVALNNVTSLAAGRNHSLALLNGGTVWAWGDNSSGQLGDTTTTNRNAPVLTAVLANITQISTRDGSGLALDNTGVVWGWGSNISGQVGDGTVTSPISTPEVSQIGGATVASFVASGAFHSLAIVAGGSTEGWGLNSTGQLSDIPPQVFTAATGLQSVSGPGKISAGYLHTLAYMPDGTVLAFGNNGSGQLGDNTATQRLIPVTVLGPGGVGLLNLLGLYNLSVTIAGGGVVTSSPAGMTCSVGTCIATFGSGTVVTLTASPTSGNSFQGWGGQCSGSSTCTITIDGAKAVSAAFSGSSGGGPVVGTIPDTGWWWNPNEPGRGYMIEQSNGKIFLATFLYEAGGRASWFGSGPTAFGGGSYSGVLNLYASGQTLTGAYKQATVVGGTFGSIDINFSSSTTATLIWPGGTIPIQRFDFGPGGSGAAPPSGTPQAGWWWYPAEGGRGFSLEIQGGTMLVAGYMYDGSGNPIWYSSQGTMTTPSLYQGNWTQYGYGQTLTGTYRAASVVNSSVGALSIQFSSATSGVMYMPDGRPIQIQRFAF